MVRRANILRNAAACICLLALSSCRPPINTNIVITLVPMGQPSPRILAELRQQLESAVGVRVVVSDKALPLCAPRTQADYFIETKVRACFDRWSPEKLKAWTGVGDISALTTYSNRLAFLEKLTGATDGDESNLAAWRVELASAETNYLYNADDLHEILRKACPVYGDHAYRSCLGITEAPMCDNGTNEWAEVRYDAYSVLSYHPFTLGHRFVPPDREYLLNRAFKCTLDCALASLFIPRCRTPRCPHAELELCPEDVRFSDWVRTTLCPVCRNGLFLCSADRRSRLAAFLKRKRIDVDAEDDHGWSTFMGAVIRNDVELVAEMISLGADVNRPGFGNWTPLHRSVWRGYIGMSRLLLENGANPNAGQITGQTALQYAVQDGNLDVATLLLQYGASPTNADAEGSTPLYEVRFAHTEAAAITRLLLEHGANPNAVLSDGWFPLLRAADLDATGLTVEILLEHGADPMHGFPDGTRPIHQAAWQGNLTAVEALIRRGVPLDIVDGHSNTPLLCAAWAGASNLVAYLADHGAKLNAADDAQRVPLTCAILRQKFDVARLLILRGCELNTSDKDGYTPLIAAARGNNRSLVELLIERGAGMDFAGQDGRTPLMSAAEKGYTAIIAFLLQRGADINKSGPNGTALDEALRANQNEAADVLRRHGAKQRTAEAGQSTG